MDAGIVERAVRKLDRRSDEREVMKVVDLEETSTHDLVFIYRT